MTKQEALENALGNLEWIAKNGFDYTGVEKDPFYKPVKITVVSLYGHSGYYMSNGKMYRKYISYKGR
jgi:hypothetical protein